MCSVILQMLLLILTLIPLPLERNFTLFLLSKAEGAVQRRTNWRIPYKIKETRRAKRSDVDLSKKGDRSLLVAGAWS